jgi:Large polyvalent protein associated domain 30
VRLTWKRKRNQENKKRTKNGVTEHGGRHQSFAVLTRCAPCAWLRARRFAPLWSRPPCPANADHIQQKKGGGMNSQREPIVVGTMVSTVLYNRGRGYVLAIHGSQRPETVQPRFGGTMMSGGSASFDIVFECGTYSRRLPEAILHGVQWTVFPRAKGFADHGYYGVVNGVPTIMRLCRWTGASALTPFELVAVGGRGHAGS